MDQLIGPLAMSGAPEDNAALPAAEDCRAPYPSDASDDLDPLPLVMPAAAPSQPLDVVIQHALTWPLPAERFPFCADKGAPTAALVRQLADRVSYKAEDIALLVLSERDQVHDGDDNCSMKLGGTKRPMPYAAEC